MKQLYTNLHKKFQYSIEFRLTFWYAVVFILSWIVLFTAGFTLLDKSIKEKDRRIIREIMANYALVADSTGTDLLVKNLKKETMTHMAEGHFLMVSSPDHGIYHLTIPYGWPDLDHEKLQKALPYRGDQWVSLTTDQYSIHNEQRSDELEIAGQRLKDGSLLHMGHSAEFREELLEHFRDIFLLIMLVVVLVSIFIGMILARRSMAPVKALTNTVARVRSGSIKARVPLSDTENELQELAWQFNKMLDRIETLIQGMGQALDNVAHDLRTPLTRMGISIERAVLDSDPEQLREALFDCAEESQRISSMLNTLMDISEAETGAMQLNYTKIMPNLLIDGVMEIYQYAAQEKRVILESHCTPDLVFYADKNRMQQLLCNLIDNAVKYSQNNSHVTITASQEEKFLKITVQDNGIGIQPGEISKIFDRLYRSDKSRQEKGCGLGLSLVKAVINAHNGTITVKSTPGKGSAFILSLPMAPPPRDNG